MHEIITWETIKEKYSVEYELLLDYIRNLDNFSSNNLFSVLNDLSAEEKVQTFENLNEILRASMFTSFLRMKMPGIDQVSMPDNDPGFEMWMLVHEWLCYVENDQYERLN